MKKALIVDTDNRVSDLKRPIEGTKIVIKRDFNDLFDSVRLKYDFDWNKWTKEHYPENYPDGGRTSMAYGMALGAMRQHAFIDSLQPYWDAVLIFVRDKGDLLTALGAALMASACGCKRVYVEIHWSNFRVAKEFRYEKLDWLQPKVWNDSRYFFNQHLLFCLRENDNTYLVHPVRYIAEILMMIDKYAIGKHRFPDENCLLISSAGKPDMTMAEYFSSVWPGLPWKDALWNRLE